MTAALVGPLQPVHYASGAPEYRDLPRNTLDIRYVACGNHHPACDCREAMLGEEIGEYRSMFRDVEAAITEAIKGHPTWAYSRDGYSEDPAGQCQCAACGIARKCFIGYAAWVHARDAADRQLYPNEDVPF